jgi:hypothetical protein
VGSLRTSCRLCYPIIAKTQAHQGRERKALTEVKAVVLRKGFVPSHADAIFTDVSDENIQQIREALHRFAYQALTSYAKHEPRADHLLQLIQLNVINSFTRNADVLGLRLSLTTSLVFDLGVYLVVIGTVAAAVNRLARFDTDEPPGRDPVAADRGAT